MEICSRALSFWVYQITQEFAYQKSGIKELESKNSSLDRRLNGLVRDAQSEVSNLKQELDALQKEHELEKRKNLDLFDQLNEKSRQFQKLQV